MTTIHDTADLVSRALRRAWQLGQTYWQQADSKYQSHWKKADATQTTFDQLVEDTRAAILAANPGAQPATSVPDGWKLVPIEVTREMREAGLDDWQYGNKSICGSHRDLAASNSENGGRVMDTQELRRLLELAARAVGYTIFDWYGERFTAHDGEKLIGWNPLTDDGDALRLAVTLRLTVNLTECRCCVGIYACQLDGEGDYPDISVRHSPEFDDAETTDPCAATRLAIVRAAAAVGEKMEERP